MHRLAVVSLAIALGACAGEDERGASTDPSTIPTPGAASTPASALGAAGSAANASNTPAVTRASTAANPTSAMRAAGRRNTKNPGVANPTSNGVVLAMDECGLKTNYPGDEYCINAPPSDKGFQVHIGPSSYENVESKYLVEPGEENVVNLSATSGNDKEVLYYYRQYRMRPGSHHVLITANGRRIGGTQNLARDNPVNGVIPPENEGVGLTMAPHATINANMHFYNYTEKPMVRDLWTNYWYKEPGTVTETAKEIFSMTGVTAAVARTHVVVGASCPVTGDGRLLSLQGHRHLSNVRFSFWHNSGGTKNLLMEEYDPDHPASFEYNSLTTNPMPDKAMRKAGAASGIINLKAGDTIDFECEIINNTDTDFVGLNEAANDEMCIMTGDSVGASVSGRCAAFPARRITAGAPAAE